MRKPRFNQRQINDIRTRGRGNTPYTHLAAEYGCAPSMISGICEGTYYASVPEAEPTESLHEYIDRLAAEADEDEPVCVLELAVETGDIVKLRTGDGPRMVVIHIDPKRELATVSYWDRGTTCSSTTHLAAIERVS